MKRLSIILMDEIALGMKKLGDMLLKREQCATNIMDAYHRKIMIGTLCEKYEGVKFTFVEDKYFILLVYNNEVLGDDEEFINFTHELVQRHLKMDEMIKFGIVYDYDESCFKK